MGTPSEQGTPFTNTEEAELSDSVKAKLEQFTEAMFMSEECSPQEEAVSNPF